MCIKIRSIGKTVAILLLLCLANISYGAVYYLPAKIDNTTDTSGYNSCKQYMYSKLGPFQTIGGEGGINSSLATNTGYDVLTDPQAKNCLLTYKKDSTIFIYLHGASGSNQCVNHTDCTSRGDVVAMSIKVSDFYAFFLPKNNYNLFVYTGKYGTTSASCGADISGGGGGATAMWTSDGITPKLIAIAGGGGGGYKGGGGGSGNPQTIPGGIVYPGGDAGTNCSQNGGCGGGTTTGGYMGGKQPQWIKATFTFNGTPYTIDVPVGSGGGGANGGNIATTLNGGSGSGGNGGFGGGGGGGSCSGGGGGGYTGGGGGVTNYPGGGGSSYCATPSGSVICRHIGGWWPLEGANVIYLPMW